MQDKKNKEQEIKDGGLKDKLADLNEKATNISNAATTDANPQTRIVRLVVGEECGCGGVDIDIDREVPYDSPLQNGDRVAEFEDADNIIN